MKLATKDQWWFLVLHRSISAILIGLLLGLALGEHLAPSTVGRVVVGVVFGLIAYRTQSVTAAVIVPIAAIAATAFLFQISGFALPDRLTFFWVMVVVVLFAGVIAWKWQLENGARIQAVDLFLLALVVFILRFLTRQSTWDAREAFAAVSMTGEDNGTWLNGVAITLQRDAAIDSLQALTNFGHLGTVLATLVVGIARMFGIASETVGQSAVLTMQMYWLLTAAASLFAARITYLLSTPYVGRLAALSASLAAISMVPFAEGFISGGHLSALLAATVLLASVLVLVEKPFSELGTSLLAVLLLFGATDAWWPLRGVVPLLICGAAATLFVSGWANRGRYMKVVQELVSALRRGSPAAWSTGIAIGALTLIFVSGVMRLDGRSPIESLNYAVSLLGVDGGKAEADPILVVVLFLLAFVASARVSNGTASRKLFSLIIGSCMCFVSLLVAYGFVQPPYSPQYPAYKLTYLMCLMLVPVSIAGLTMVVAQLCKSRSITVLAVAAVTIMGSLTYFQPYPRLRNLLNPPPAEFWADAAFQELTRNPERLVLCLDTREQWEEADGHNCSRLLAGIQGKSSEETTIWSGVNLCRVTPMDVAALPTEFWQNLTLLVTNRDRLVSTDECDTYGWSGPGLPEDDKYPIGVLTAVPWKVVRVIGADGQEATKSFSYLRGEVPDAVVDRLERSLTG